MAGGAVIFDCDGVLVDSEYLSAGVLRDLALEEGIDLTEREAFALLHGRRVADWVAELEAGLGHPLREDFVPEFRMRCATVFDQRLEAVPGVERVLAGLRLPFCTASSAPLEKVNHELARTGLAKYFAGRVFSAYEIGFWKPDPHIFLHAAAHLEVPPARCAVVEDSLPGVIAGKRAGMTVFGYADDNTAAALSVHCTKVFRSMRELPGLLAEWQVKGTVNA